MDVAIAFATALLVFVLALPLYRVVRGPSVFDRLLAAGVIGTKIVALILLIGELFGRLDMFIDIALAYAILNFIGAIAVALWFLVSPFVEEPWLAEQFGDEYRAYCRAVPRFFGI